MIIKFKKQYRFPLLKKMENAFPFLKGNKNVVYSYNGVIYSNTKLPDHLLIHETVHLKQQEKAEDLDKWVDKFIEDPDFRFKIEFEAYQEQLDSIQDPEFKTYIRGKIIEDLSGPLYGQVRSKEEIEKLLK